MICDLFNEVYGAFVMCGFAGYIACDFNDPRIGTRAHVSAKARRKALKTIENRGPDAKGEWENQHIWLGHRRLSIVDITSRGDQPMEYGNFVIAFFIIMTISSQWEKF